MRWIRRTCSLTLVLLMLIAPLVALGQQAPFETVVLGMEELQKGSLDQLEASPDGLRVTGAEEGVYTSPEMAVQPFEYVVLSWNGQASGDAALEVEARFFHREADAWTDWLSWGRWETSPKRTSKSGGSELARIDTDIAWVTGENTRGTAIQLRATLTGAEARLRRLVFSTWDTAVAERPVDSVHQGGGFDGELAYSQYTRESTIAAVMCSAVTTCTQLNLLGEHYLPEEIALHQYDAGLNGFGNWSFNMALAGELGYKAYVTFGDEEELLRLLDAGLPVGMSVKYSNTQGGPYPYLEGAPTSTGGHLITIRGYELEGGERFYLVSDSAADSDDAARFRYRSSQLMDAWDRRVLYVVMDKELDTRAITRIDITMQATDKEGTYQLAGDMPYPVKLGYASGARRKPGSGYIGYTVDGEPGTRFDVMAAGDNLVKFTGDVDVGKVTLYVMTNKGLTYVARLAGQ